jgi:hypothetical protein
MKANDIDILSGYKKENEHLASYSRKLERCVMDLDMRWYEISTLPESAIEVLVCNVNQGGVKQLVSWDNVHKYWVSKGEPDLHFQWTHWMPVPRAPRK